MKQISFFLHNLDFLNIFLIEPSPSYFTSYPIWFFFKVIPNKNVSNVWDMVFLKERSTANFSGGNILYQIKINKAL